MQAQAEGRAGQGRPSRADRAQQQEEDEDEEEGGTERRREAGRKEGRKEGPREGGTGGKGAYSLIWDGSVKKQRSGESHARLRYLWHPTRTELYPWNFRHSCPSYDSKYCIARCG